MSLGVRGAGSVGLRRRRRSLAVLVGALVISLSAAAPALAAARQVSIGTTTIRPPIGEYKVAFQGNWDVYQTRDAGQTWWIVSKIQIKGQMVNGTMCFNAGTCVSKWMEAKVQFLNAAGTVVYTISQLPAGSCWADMQVPADQYLYHCRSSSLQLNSSVNRIRFTARWNVYDGWGLLYRSGQVIKTVPIS